MGPKVFFAIDGIILLNKGFASFQFTLQWRNYQNVTFCDRCCSVRLNLDGEESPSEKETMIKSNCNLTPEVSGVNLRRWITPGDFVFPRVEIHLNTKALLDRDRQHNTTQTTRHWSIFWRIVLKTSPFKSQKQCCRKLQTSPMYKIEENVNWILDIKIDQNIDTFWSLKTPSMDNKFTLGETSTRPTNPRTAKI